MPEPKSSSENNTVTFLHLKDSLLYLDNDYALAQLKNNEVELKEKVLFHAFWQGELSRKQVFSIKSFLCTQDLANSDLILWLDKNHGFDNYQNNPYLKDLLKFITVKKYDAEVEAEGTILQNLVKQIPANEVAHKSDAFRMLILGKYGGVYFDLDVMFLRDMKPLLEQDFCYAWEQQPHANTAIFYLRKTSTLIPYIYIKCLRKGTFYPWDIFNYDDLRFKSLMVYPCAFFDPIWMRSKGQNDNYPFSFFSDFFREFSDTFPKKKDINSYRDFFSGAFAYHWHNCWNDPEFPNSYFGLFDQEFDEYIDLLK